MSPISLFYCMTSWPPLAFVRLTVRNGGRGWSCLKLAETLLSLLCTLLGFQGTYILRKAAGIPSLIYSSLSS